jgi:hypothetical protein
LPTAFTHQKHPPDAFIPRLPAPAISSFASGTLACSTRSQKKAPAAAQAIADN